MRKLTAVDISEEQVSFIMVLALVLSLSSQATERQHGVTEPLVLPMKLKFFLWERHLAARISWLEATPTKRQFSKIRLLVKNE